MRNFPYTALPVALLLTALLLGTASPALAQVPTDTAAGSSELDLMNHLARPLILSVVFTVIGCTMFAICICIIIKVMPFSVRKEIEEDQNTALGIIIGSIFLGMAIILAAAILG